MTRQSHRRIRVLAARLGGGLMLVAMLGMSVLGASAIGSLDSAPARADDGDYDISVDVLGPTPSASPTDSTVISPPPAGGGSGGGSHDPEADPADPAHGGSGAHSPARALFSVGGLHSRYLVSINPGAGTVAGWVVVRNGSSKTITAKATFWLTNVTGSTVGRSADVEISHLKPGETRTVSAFVDDVGQWSIVTLHAQVTPPKVVDGISMKPIVREQFLILPAWLVIALGATGAVITVTTVQIVRAIRFPFVGVPA